MTEAVAPETTTVDGQGMWQSWTRVFAKPESACLDLLDNCFDATVHPDFYGKVSLESDSSLLFIRNNSQRPIKRLEDALTVYKSSKNSQLADNCVAPQRAVRDSAKQKTVIGENGVGLKHGCATLSDCSVILTRNHNVVAGFGCGR